MIEVPWQDIAPETLQRLLEEFVSRDGTDYGDQEVPQERKVQQVMAQLRRGLVLVVFDEASESVNVMTRDDFRKLPS
ncbi:MAG: YheU family protein [Pseudomonadota bacterium]